MYLTPVSIEACYPPANTASVLELKHLLVLAVESSVFNVFHKADLRQDINEAILLFMSAKSGGLGL